MYMNNFFAASFRGYMRECYHEKCDNANNPRLNFERSIDFIHRTAQAVTLAVAELAEGIKKCNIQHLFQPAAAELEHDAQTPAVHGIKGKL